MERVTSVQTEPCGLSDRDAWDLVAQIVVRESAVAAGLRVAVPDDAGPTNRLLVFTGSQGSGAALSARLVHVQAIGYGERPVTPKGDLNAGELLGLYDAASAHSVSVYLLTIEQVRETREEWTPDDRWRGTPERWRELMAR